MVSWRRWRACRRRGPVGGEENVGKSSADTRGGGGGNVSKDVPGILCDKEHDSSPYQYVSGTLSIVLAAW